MKKILVPIKETGENIEVIEEVVKFAEKFDSTITLLHVDNIHLILRELQYGSEIEKTDLEINEEERKQLLEKVEEKYRNKNVKVESKLFTGEPAQGIINEAEEGDYDLVIMKTHGMSATKRFMLGSVTDKVVHHVKKPIMVVR